MECRSCGAVVSSAFKFAISKNECPACGNCLLDEESLALIEDVENTIKSEAAVREETAHNLATIIVAKYNMSFKTDEIYDSPKPQPKVSNKIAPPSTMKQAMQKPNVVKLPEVPDGISEQEREKIMEQAVAERYKMVDHIQSEIFTEDVQEEVQHSEQPSNSIFSEGNASPILEQERLARLAKQQRAMSGGGTGSFRRSS